MKTIHFSKYQGAGNDFVMINAVKQPHISITSKQINLLCNRHWGIGADGLIILRKHQRFDFEMCYFNSNGLLGTFCGNGSRCIIQFALDQKVIKKKAISFLASDGRHDAHIYSDGSIRVTMKDVRSLARRGKNQFFLNSGSPHLVKIVDNVTHINDADFGKKAARIRHHPVYTSIGGTNINFIQILNREKILIRTYERGVEAETLACGTGMTAAALVANKDLVGKGHVEVVSKGGGKLIINFESDGNQSFTHITQRGYAKRVFEGVIHI